MAHANELTWVAAAPLWKGLVKDRERMRRPALLRFASDEFMEELFALVESAPDELASRVATREAGSDTLKLYQPVHGHFHLVAASLVCQLPGLPDHSVDAAREEKASFVLRRLAGDQELAWIPSADPTKPGAWQSVSDPESIAEGEQLSALSPVSFVEGGRRRRLLVGLIPTSNREAFHAAEVTDPAEVPLFVIRCVYAKPRCKPPERSLLSDPSERFALASYFDLDAPTRSVRITMPVSLDGLKSLKKGLGFVLSKNLHDKLAQVPKILPEMDPIATPAATGKICSFSIPIVTLVAMIVLMVFVTLLNLVFGWIQFVMACLPLPSKPQE